MENKIHFKCADVEEAAKLILEKFDTSNAYVFPMRFALAIGQRVCFKSIPLTPPSLDIGVNDGSTACIIHYGKPRFTWGGDMPEESTYESMGLFVSPEFNVYDNLVGLDVSSAVPFPDNSFNTICATEVFAYGLDRDKALREMCRVLAPGGTLAFSENAEDILNFPALIDGLKQYVPMLDILKNSRAYYRQKLAELGLIDVDCRLYFRRPLAGLLYALMYAADPAADHNHHRRLLVEDQRLRRFYTDGLLAIASGLDDEFSRSEGPSDGWHIFVSARKAGDLNADLPSPTFRCPVCHFGGLDISLLDCRCRHCGRSYKTRYGIPYLLRDDNATYSPKTEFPAHLKEPIPPDHHIDAVLRASYPLLRDPGDNPCVRLAGVDPATAFTIRHLRENGVRVVAVGTTIERLVGRHIEGIPIQSVREFDQSTVPVLLSGHPGEETAGAETLASTGFAGTVFSISHGTAETGWRQVDLEVVLRDRSPGTNANGNFIRRLARKFLRR